MAAIEILIDIDTTGMAWRLRLLKSWAACGMYRDEQRDGWVRFIAEGARVSCKR